MDKENIYNKLISAGNFYSVTRRINVFQLEEELGKNPDWVEYNKAKPGFKRQGLSLYSLDGGTSGEGDLDSIYEYNLRNNTTYGEMSFRTPTPYWNQLKCISSSFKELEPHLGRSHLIKFGFGGMFPPHRDLGDSFRLIALFSTPSAMYLTVERQLMSFDTGRVYFLNGRLVHSLVSFDENAMVLVLNVEINEKTLEWVHKNLEFR